MIIIFEANTTLMRHLKYSSLFLILCFLSACTDFKTDKNIRLELEEDIYHLAADELEGRAFGTIGEEKAAKYLADRFQAIGLAPKGTDGFFQEFVVNKPTNPHEQAKMDESGDGLKGRNVVAYLDNGSQNTIAIGAHFDHLGYGSEGSLHRGEPAIHNGADDNASGTAALLQLAGILKNKDLDTNVLFIAFSGEENGLWGSNYFVKNPTIDLNSISYMFNMDMVGRLNEENTLAINGVGTSPDWNETLALANSDSLKLVTSESGVGPSDHTSFYLQDLPVLHFFTGQHEDYHKPSDDADKINYDGLVKVVRFIERLIVEMDQPEKLAFTKTKEDEGNSPRFSVSLGVVPDYLYDGEGMRIDGVSEGKPAQAAGMKKGDIVVKLGDSTIVDMMSYMRALSGFKTGEEAIVEYKRGEELKAAKIKF